MYMIIIKVDCCGHPQTSSDAMQFKHLDVLRCYAGERVKETVQPRVNIFTYLCICTQICEYIYPGSQIKLNLGNLNFI